MIQLANTLDAWGTPDFSDRLKAEIENLDINLLPLQQELSSSSYVTSKNIEVMILGAGETEGLIKAKAGIFYSGIIAGCNCADDPTPVDEINEYCEVVIDIDKSSGEATITPAA